MTRTPTRTSRRAPAGDPGDRLVTAGELAEICGRSIRWVHSLREAGHLRSEGGRYRLGVAVQGVLSHLEARTAARGEVAATLARTREIELRTGMRRAALISTAELTAMLREMGEVIEAEFSGLPDRVYPDDAARREGLVGLVRDIFERVQERRETLEAELRGENLSGDGIA